MKKVIYSEQFQTKHSYNLMNNPTIVLLKSTLKKLYLILLFMDFKVLLKTIEGIGDDRLINVAKAIVSNNSKFKNAFIERSRIKSICSRTKKKVLHLVML